jgi:hypothetical protein
MPQRNKAQILAELLETLDAIDSYKPYLSEAKHPPATLEVYIMLNEVCLQCLKFLISELLNLRDNRELKEQVNYGITNARNLYASIRKNTNIYKNHGGNGDEKPFENKSYRVQTFFLPPLTIIQRRETEVIVNHRSNTRS